MMKRPNVWFIISGGGARGRSELPQIQGAIDEALAITGKHPDGFVGNSIGATAARFAAANAMSALEEFSNNIVKERDVQRVNDINPLNGWKSLNVFMRRLRPYLEENPCVVECWVLVTDRSSWAPSGIDPEYLPGAKLIRIDELSIDDQLMWIGRSSAILPYHEPVEGWRYMDGGGVAVYPPLPERARQTCTRLYAIGASPYRVEDRTYGKWKKGALGVIEQLSEIHVGNVLNNDIARLNKYALDMEVFLSAPDNIEDVGGSFEFGPEIDKRRVEAGKRAWINRRKLG
jgi:hypothetical protein